MHNHSATIVDGSFSGRFSVSRRPWMLLVLATVLLVVAATPVTAAPITVPTSLSPGDQYRLAFLTSTFHDATSSDINVYNDFVTGVANGVPELSALGTTWRAIGSTASVNARDNTDTLPFFAGGELGVPIFLLNGDILAVSNDDLWDAMGEANPLVNPLDWDERGRLVFILPSTVFTGSSTDGEAAVGFTLGVNGFLGPVVTGLGVLRGAGWIMGATRFPTNSAAFYAMSGFLTVPVVPVTGVIPEPGSVILMAIGAALLMGAGGLRRRKRASESS